MNQFVAGENLFAAATVERNNEKHWAPRTHKRLFKTPPYCYLREVALPNLKTWLLGGGGQYLSSVHTFPSSFRKWDICGADVFICAPD